ncbi:hypothetical protein BCEN4_660095 [Burkholderia cenocepacia]|nr:hypothetical protein BCEN4_660095 [Burkholderia cenocepacia]
MRCIRRAAAVLNTLAARPAKANEAISIRISQKVEEGLQGEWGGANGRGGSRARLMDVRPRRPAGWCRFVADG